MASIKGRKPDVDAVKGGGPDVVRHGKNPHPPREPGDKHKNIKQRQMAGESQGGGGGSKGGVGTRRVEACSSQRCELRGIPHQPSSST